MSDQNQDTEKKDQGQKTGGGKKFPPVKNPKFKFNFYWIYGIIIVILFITQMFQWGGGERETTYENFERTMLVSHDVDKIVVTGDQAHIYIKHDKLKDDKYKDV